MELISRAAMIANKKTRATIESHTTFEKRKTIVIIRSAERVDRVFPEWLRENFTDAEEYIPNDLNLPSFVLKRPNGIDGYKDDPPITEMGTRISHLVGRSLRMFRVSPFDKVLVSPALRCIQTASAIVRRFKSDVSLCVEPGLFDWMRWYDILPKFLSPAYLKDAGYPIELSYTPHTDEGTLHRLAGRESIRSFYHRVQKTVEFITKGTKPERILLICHATTMDAAVKTFRKGWVENLSEAHMAHMGTTYPYASVITLVLNNKKWSFVHDAIPPLSYVGASTRINTTIINGTLKC
uniref:Protein UBASH3A n=1 Tax=Ascaris suum TaxID=6253 RepID=F1LA82_ASCSU